MNQSDVNLIWTNLVPIEVKNTQLAESQDHKGTPFEKFSDNLSTNEKPAFQALNQWEISISARFLLFPKPRIYQFNHNQVRRSPIEHSFRSLACSAIRVKCPRHSPIHNGIRLSRVVPQE